jgi:predicted DNA-binding transcriptional regulator AlpA
MERFISKDQVRQLFGVSKSTIDRWVRAGKLPRPRRRFGFLRWDYEQVVALLKFKVRL